MIATSLRRFALVWAAVLFVILLGLAAPARAQSCNEDLGKIAAERQAQIDGLNAQAKSSKSHQLDPIASCPKLRALSATEGRFLDYMVKNKDWCSIPDETLESVKSNRAKTAAVASKACAIAVQIKRAQQQQASGGVPAGAPEALKLPTGPL